MNTTGTTTEQGEPKYQTPSTSGDVEDKKVNNTVFSKYSSDQKEEETDNSQIDIPKPKMSPEETPITGKYTNIIKPPPIPKVNSPSKLPPPPTSTPNTDPPPPPPR